MRKILSDMRIYVPTDSTLISFSNNNNFVNQMILEDNLVCLQNKGIHWMFLFLLLQVLKRPEYLFP